MNGNGYLRPRGVEDEIYSCTSLRMPRTEASPSSELPEPQTGSADSSSSHNASSHPSDSISSARFTSNHWIYLLLFTIIATVVRFWEVGTWSVWVDEAFTYRDVTASWEDFMETGTSRYPLSFMLVRAISSVMGLAPHELSETVMRLPFVLFGIASVPALALVARGMVGRRAALLAALFLSISPWHIYWSQNARSYSMMLFTGLLAMGATYHGYQRRSWPLLVAAVALFLLSGLSHPSSYVVVASALVYLLIAAVLEKGSGSKASKWGPPTVLVLLAIIVVLSLGPLQRAWAVKEPEVSLLHLLETVSFYVGIPVLVAAAGGMVSLFERGERSALFLTCMVVLPLLCLSVLASIAMQKVSAQYAFAILPALYILAAYLVISLVQVFPSLGLRALILRSIPLGMVVLHMLGQDFLYFKKEYGWRPRWSEAVQYVVETQVKYHEDRELRVLTTNESSVKYYIDRMSKGTVDPNSLVQSIEDFEMARHGGPASFLQKRIDEAKSLNHDLWVILTEPVLDEKDDEAKADIFLRANFHQLRRLPNWTGPKDMVLLIYYLEY